MPYPNPNTSPEKSEIEKLDHLRGILEKFSYPPTPVKPAIEGLVEVLDHMIEATTALENLASPNDPDAAPGPERGPVSDTNNPSTPGPGNYGPGAHFGNPNAAPGPEKGPTSGTNNPSTPGPGNYGGGNNSGGPTGGGASGDHGRNGGYGGGKKPLVLDLDGDGVELVALEDSTAFFDADDDGYLENVGWASGDDGFLVYDENGSGTVDQSKELVLAEYAGFEGATDLDGLATFDSNDDGIFNASDDAFRDFRVWRDLDQDGESDEGELFTLDELGIESIDLTKRPVAEEDQDPNGTGNNILNTTTFTRSDGTTGEVGDVALAVSSQGYRLSETGDGVELQIEDATRTLLFARDGTTLNVDAHLAGHAGMYGNSGNDVLTNEGSEDTVLSGGAGADRLEGGSGTDWLSGDAGADALMGGAGHDVLFVDADDTTIDGGDGYDIIQAVSDSAGVTLDLFATNTEAALGSQGNDTFDASGVTDDAVLTGEDGDDVLTGGYGNDILSGGDGADSLSGNDGNDKLVIDAHDTFDGGEGVDTVYYTGSEDLDLNITENNVEIFFAGDGDDTI